MLRYCEFCGTEFETPNVRRLYCCQQCRRKAQDERRQDERAEAAELAEAMSHPMPDVWERNDLGEDVTAGALLDGWTSECQPDCGDSLVGGVMACMRCPHWQDNANSRKKHKQPIDLLCEMCRSGVRV